MTKIATNTLTYCSAIAALLLTVSPLHANACAQSIARVQTQLDAAIETRAASGGWQPEGLNALRGYQPTPRSLAMAEGDNGRRYADALNMLARARAADRAGDAAACQQELANARAVLRQ